MLGSFLQKLLQSSLKMGFLVWIFFMIIVTCYTLRRGFVDKCDGYNYFASGYSLYENKQEFTFVNINSYFDFQKSPINYKPIERPYPNKLYSVIAYAISKSGQFIEPFSVALYSIIISSIGFLFFYLLCYKIAGPYIAIISAITVLGNIMMISYLGRPLTDPSAWAMIIISYYFLSRHSSSEDTRKDFNIILAALAVSLASCFRMQALYMLPVVLLYIFFYQKQKYLKSNITLAIKTVLIFTATYFIITHAIQAFFLNQQSYENSNSQFYLSWFSEVFSKFSIYDYYETFKDIMSQILLDIHIGIPLVISFLKGPTFKSSRIIRFLHMSAVVSFVLPILIYSMSKGFETRYLIYSIPIFIFCSLINIKDLIYIKIKSHYKKHILAAAILSYFVINLVFRLYNYQQVAYLNYANIKIPIENIMPIKSRPHILTNKSISVVNTGQYSLVRLPEYNVFFNGDNSLVSYIILYNDYNCAWEKSEDSVAYQNKIELSDKSGERFVLNLDKSFYQTLVYEYRGKN